jgi:hypothetical protein
LIIAVFFEGGFYMGEEVELSCCHTGEAALTSFFRGARRLFLCMWGFKVLLRPS